MLKHTVKSGESIYSIAKKYGVSESDIYNLNPKSKGVLLQLKTILLIPNKKSLSNNKDILSSNIKSDIHIVEAGESLYKISKKYNITIDKLIELNPSINPSTIQIGDKIIVNQKKEEIKSNSKEINPILNKSIKNENNFDNLCTDEIGNQYHIANKGETLYKISKMYKVSVKDLEEMNPEIVSNLPIGYEVIIIVGKKELENQKNDIVEKVNNSIDPPISDMSEADFLIIKASEYLGTKYRGGGTNSSGFDCSGLMYATFKLIQMELPRSSSLMAANAGYRIDRSQAQKGDLIFFSTNGRGSINHVGLITEIEGNEIKFIHASVQSGVIISSTEEPYYKKRFVQINRILKNN